MRVYILRKKNVGEWSWEHHVVFARGKRQLEQIVKDEMNEDIKQFNVEEKTQPGCVYTSVY